MTTYIGVASQRIERTNSNTNCCSHAARTMFLTYNGGPVQTELTFQKKRDGTFAYQ